ncbi:MAG: ferrochelatase [Planctomycetaceae bacterium]|nr:MAG: ferrochelatase [Planctomycetaceae bacterium]
MSDSETRPTPRSISGSSRPDHLAGANPTDGAGYDAILVVGFGGPEKPADVMPFLENVLRGRNVPRERMLEVAAHYDHFDGVSPINSQMRALIAALQGELDSHGPHLPIYWGNRNWHPMLEETLRQMTADGVRHALAYVASGYSSYSGCRQYREDILRARQAVGAAAPTVDKIRVFYNHPRFIAASAAKLRSRLADVPVELAGKLPVVFTAHSIPASMSRGCAYEQQLRETCRLTAEAAGIAADQWRLVYQSRSGRPEDPWLSPDILDEIRDLAKSAALGLVIMPVGFLSDHMEVMYDLDYEALHLCQELGLKYYRAETVGTHPEFVTMIRELIEERVSGTPERLAIGCFPANHDVCPEDCCLPPQRPAARVAAGA